MKYLATLYLICLIKVCVTVNFAHLCGYSLTADTFVECSTADAADCADLCDVTDTCIGFEYFEETGDCNLINAIRNVESNYTFCSFYMKTTTKQMTIQGRSLSTTDQMLQNLLYESQGTCPDGWRTASTKCTLKLSEEKCAEFASFLNASYSNGLCVIPLITLKPICPTDVTTWALKAYSDGYYCLKVIPRFAGSPAPLSYVDACQQACANIGGYFASIHSAAENSDMICMFFQHLTVSITDFTAINGGGSQGMAIGLISVTGQIVGNWSMSWYDNTTVTYKNWGGGPETTVADRPVFQLTIIMPDTFWHTNYLNFNAFFDTIACKQKARNVRVLGSV
uniref:Apple domain-containing protein n=1 Tax=Panagrellus redivivus TaxID=6233 RepID=A0A7E4V3A6_PANRE